jgi:hypothetical protein
MRWDRADRGAFNGSFGSQNGGEGFKPTFSHGRYVAGIEVIRYEYNNNPKFGHAIRALSGCPKNKI